MSQFTTFSISNIFILYFLTVAQFSEGDATCDSPYTVTDGNMFNSMKNKYSTLKPFETIRRTNVINCIMLWMVRWKAEAMNAVDDQNGRIICQLLEQKANEDLHGNSILIIKKNSTYYERIDEFVKATPSAIVVGAKDDRPGLFEFQLPTGYYKIKLNHLSGGSIFKPDQLEKTPFACKFHGLSKPSCISLLHGFKGNVIALGRHFSEYEGEMRSTRFVATSSCFYLIEGEKYSFWYFRDLKNISEHNSSGETSFEMFVKLCEKDNECI